MLIKYTIITLLIATSLGVKQRMDDQMPVFVIQRNEAPSQEEESPLRQLFGGQNHQSFQEQAEEEQNDVPAPIMMAVKRINRMRNNQMKRHVPVFAAPQDEEEHPMIVIRSQPEQVRPQIVFERENEAQEAPRNNAFQSEMAHSMLEMEKQMTEQMKVMSEMERSFEKKLDSPFEAMKSRFSQPKLQAGQADQAQVVKEFTNEEFSNKETITDCDNKTSKCTVKTCLNGKCNYEDPQP